MADWSRKAGEQINQLNKLPGVTAADLVRLKREIERKADSGGSTSTFDLSHKYKIRARINDGLISEVLHEGLI